MGDSVVERVRHAASGPSLSEEKNRVGRESLMASVSISALIRAVAHFGQRSFQAGRLCDLGAVRLVCPM